MKPLDSILGGGEAVSDGQTQEQEQVTQANEADGQQAEQQQEQTEGQQQEGDKGQHVPMAALHAEKQKVKRYTEEVADFRRSNEALQRQVAELMQRIPVPQQQQAEPTDFFSDPDKAFNERLQSHLGQALGPLQEQFIAQAQMLAGIKYGDDKVAEAEQAFMAAAKAGTLDPSDYQRVARSPNRYAEAVRWHQRQQAQAEIGNDPAAFKAKLEADLRAQILAEFQQQGGNQQAQQRQAGAMPSNLAAARNVGSRSGPAWAGPTPMGDIFSRIKPEF